MTLTVLLAVLTAYVIAIHAVSYVASRHNTNDTFFRGNRQSPWWAVAFGMIGASVSGVSLVSVPGLVISQNMTYMPMCLGFFVGYLLVSYGLLPLYYRLHLTSIYTYLGQRFGVVAHRTGGWFFFISKLLGASVRLFLLCMVLHRVIAGERSYPFILTVVMVVTVIWMYTRRGGIKVLVWTDVFQTVVLLVTMGMLVYYLSNQLEVSCVGAASYVADSPYSQWWIWDDWMSPRHSLKQFLSGIFVVMVMTGLDQDMMQKNLTCKTLKDAQKDMTTYGFFFIPLNLLLLSIGVLATAYYRQAGLELPAHGDDLLPLLFDKGYLGDIMPALFLLGIVAATFSSADSAMTALTTSCCVDLLDVEHRSRHPERIRKWMHALVALLMIACITVIRYCDNSSVIDTIYVLASYSYGPLLGLFALGIFTRRMPRPKAVPFVCILSPLLCALLSFALEYEVGYTFGYELLLLNALLTFSGLWVMSERKSIGLR